MTQKTVQKVFFRALEQVYSRKVLLKSDTKKTAKFGIVAQLHLKIH